MTEDLSQVCFGSISNYRWPPKNIWTTSPEKSTINGTGMPVKKRTNKFKGIIFFCHKLFSQFVVWIEIALVYKELFHLNCSKLQLNQPLLLRNKTDPEANFANTYNYIYSGACDWTRFFSENAETQINFSLVSPLKKRRPSFNGFFQNEKCEKNLNCSRIYSYINGPPIIWFFYLVRNNFFELVLISLIFI